MNCPCRSPRFSAVVLLSSLQMQGNVGFQRLNPQLVSQHGCSLASEKECPHGNPLATGWPQTLGARRSATLRGCFVLQRCAPLRCSALRNAALRTAVPPPVVCAHVRPGASAELAHAQLQQLAPHLGGLPAAHKMQGSPNSISIYFAPQERGAAVRGRDIFRTSCSI